MGAIARRRRRRAIYGAGPLFEDSLTDSNGTDLTAHTSEIGGPWINTGAGVFQVQSNAAEVITAAANNPYVADVGQTSYTYTITATPAGTGNGGVVVRSDASGSPAYYMCRVFGGKIEIFEKNPSYVKRAEVAVSAGATWTMVVTVTPTSITAAIGATEVTYNSATLAANTHVGWVSLSAGDVFDDILVEA